MVRFTLRLPFELNTQLVESAKKAERSKTAHILWILRTYLAVEKIRKPIEDDVWLALKDKRQ